MGFKELLSADMHIPDDNLDMTIQVEQQYGPSSSLKPILSQDFLSFAKFGPNNDPQHQQGQ
jgi:hypothetical protein